MGEQPSASHELILDVAAERPGALDAPAAGPGPSYDEQQLLLEMLSDPDIADALDEEDIR